MLCVFSFSLELYSVLLVAQKSPLATGSAQLAQSISSQKHPTQGGDTLNATAYVRRPVYSSAHTFHIWVMLIFCFYYFFKSFNTIYIKWEYSIRSHYLLQTKKIKISLSKFFLEQFFFFCKSGCQEVAHK